MRLNRRLLLGCAALVAGTPTVLAQARSGTSSAKLAALFESAWDADMQDDPLEADYLGDHRFASRWPDLSPAAIEARYARYSKTLADLKRIDPQALSANERRNRDLFRREYESRLAAKPFKPWLYDYIRPRDGITALSETAELLPFATTQDYEDWIARLNGVSRYIDQLMGLLETGLREKRTQPREIMERIPPQLALQIPSDAEASPFFAPFARMPETIEPTDRERLIGAGGRAIDDVVVPAFRRFDRFFREQYLPASRASVGISDTPDGAAFYRDRIQFHTTTSMSSDEIHALGLAEVARIRAEMDGVIRKVGFRGSFAQFLEFLRTDPRFYYPTAQQLFDAYAVTAKKIDPELCKQFGKLPRTPYGVRAIPATSAPNTTTAYYNGPAVDGTRAGYYYVNLYRPEVRPKYEIEVLTVHEAVPGHHLQIALAMEQQDQPMFRRNADFTAYTEGWALYSEQLGESMGLYQDPYSKFGQLTYDMWRAVRLVIDTGMHAKQWPRQQAIDYFKANAAKTEADIVNEVDRYIAWPGQALAYKIGQREILRLRAKAQSDLGARFDVRRFHDVVLSTGAVPLDVLAADVDAWIVKERGVS